MNTYPIHENSRLGMPKAPCGSLSPCFAFLCVTYFIVTQSFTKQASSYTENNRHNCYNTFANQLPSISQPYKKAKYCRFFEHIPVKSAIFTVDININNVQHH